MKKIILPSERPGNRVRRFMLRCLAAFTLLGAGWLAFSYLLPQDLLRQGSFYSALVALSFFGRVLTFHVGLMFASIAIIAALWRARALGWMNAVLAVACVGSTLHIPATQKAYAPAQDVFRLMSMNLKYSQAHGERFTDQIAQLKPDVLAIEDFTPYAQTTIEQALGNVYPHRHLFHNALQGLAIYSRLPFDGNRAKISFTQIRRQMRAVIVFDGQPIAIYIEHPYSPRSIQRIVNNRLATLDLVAQAQSETLPMVVAGDFNFTDATPNESALKSAGLSDAFDSAGSWRGSTWPVSPQWLQWLPGVRIDHVFISRQLTCIRLFEGKYDGSDHLPVISDIAIHR